MTDEQLLGLAAKAAGINLKRSWRSLHPDDYVYNWNPIDDDGDALRLAVKLNIDIRFERCDDGIEVIAAGEREDYPGWLHEISERDVYRDARRAIVRAAAEIGKRMVDNP